MFLKIESNVYFVGAENVCTCGHPRNRSIPSLSSGRSVFFSLQRLRARVSMSSATCKYNQKVPYLIGEQTLAEQEKPEPVACRAKEEVFFAVSLVQDDSSLFLCCEVSRGIRDIF